MGNRETENQGNKSTRKTGQEGNKGNKGNKGNRETREQLTISNWPAVIFKTTHKGMQKIRHM